MHDIERLTLSEPPPVYVVSGGVGASGEQLVRTTLAQFPDSPVSVIVVGNVRQAEQIEHVLAQAKSTGGTIAHTLVEDPLRRVLVERAQALGVTAVDLMGPLLSHLSQALGLPPLGHPGRYRRLHRAHFERVAAMEYSLAHDDGKDPASWSQAEILLVGVSRTGKTPLSLYLAVLGWKVANYPLVTEVKPPQELFAVDPSRVIGLTIEPGQLLLHRQQRQMRLGASGPSPYIDPETVYEEIQVARRLFLRSGFAVLDVTDKPIETTADEVIRLITRAFPEESSRPSS